MGWEFNVSPDCICGQTIGTLDDSMWEVWEDPDVIALKSPFHEGIWTVLQQILIGKYLNTFQILPPSSVFKYYLNTNYWG